MPGMVPIRRLRNIAPGAAAYNLDNVFNWSLYDVYLVEMFGLSSVAAGAGQWTLRGRTAAPADLAANSFQQRGLSVAGAVAAVTGLSSAPVLNITAANFNGIVGGRVWLQLESDGTAAASFRLEAALGHLSDSVLIQGQISNGPLAGIGVSFSGGVNLLIGRLNVWGLQAGGG